MVVYKLLGYGVSYTASLRCSIGHGSLMFLEDDCKSGKGWLVYWGFITGVPCLWHPHSSRQIWTVDHLRWMSVRTGVKKVVFHQDQEFQSREWQPTPVFLPGEFHGPDSLAGYSQWDHKELDTTKWLTQEFCRKKKVWLSGSDNESEEESSLSSICIT